jgi:hypothetical protein
MFWETKVKEVNKLLAALIAAAHAEYMASDDRELEIIFLAIKAVCQRAEAEINQGASE